MSVPPSPQIRVAVARVFVVAHRENTNRLEDELVSQGLTVSVLRQEHDAITREFSPNLRCLLNHAVGWEIAARSEGLSLFVESDFTPCRNFGNLLLPFDPALHGNAAWGYLYAGGPRIYAREATGHLLAHACSTVAYVMPPRVAQMGLAYLAELRTRHPDWRRYHAFDTELQWHLMGYGARAYVPWRQLGEHGGIANLEHIGTGMGASCVRRWFAHLGIGRNHYADALAESLAFPPEYSHGSCLRLLRIRIEGRATGLLRLLLGKTISPIAPLSLRARLALTWHGLHRLLG
jgi:hypothetical protein